MKYFSHLILTLILVYSCKPKNDAPLADKTLTEIRTNIEHRIKESDSTLRIDSVRFIKLDTVTEKEHYWYTLRQILNDLDIVDRTRDYYKRIADIKVDQMKMYRILESQDLVETTGKDAKENIEKAREMIALSEQMELEYDSLRKITLTADSIKPKYYEVASLVQYRKKDESVKKDTFYTLLNLEKNILEWEELANYKSRKRVQNILDKESN